MQTPVGEAITVRERVLLDLARRDKSNVLETFHAITEAVAVVLDVARVSIWELIEAESDPADAQSARIICRDMFLLRERRHTSFLPLRGHEFPAYLRAIQERRTITADDAQADPRTSEFTNFYLKPLGITSMMDVPIWHEGRVYGVLCLEHVGAMRRWQPHDRSFAIHLADIASATLESAQVIAARIRWDTVIDALAEAVGVVDSRGKLIQANPAARRMFASIAGQETLDGRQADMDLVDAADRPIPAADWPLNRALRRETIRGEIYGVIIRQTHERRYIRLTAAPLIENARIDYIVFVMVDVTEEVFFERLKRELLAGLAHELKTPLAVAKGYAQQLQKTNEPAKTGAMLDRIVRSCDRMDHLSETLLDLSSLILGRLRLTRERVDLAEVALGVIRRAEADAPSHRFELKMHAPIPLTVVVDSMRIAQAMRQVLENAVAYSPGGGPIEVELSANRERATISIRDHGIGIPATAQRGIFTVFFKAHAGTAHDRGWLGIGLYLAREILRHHGGDVWFESTEGQGSVFYLALPLAEPTT